MNTLTLKNSAVFILFFGIALFEAILEGNWAEGSLFVLLGFLFLWADLKK